MTTTSQERGFILSIIDRSLLEDAIEWIRSNLGPDDVFTQTELEEWAKDNGFVKEGASS